MTILIVEDELIEQQALTKILLQLYPSKQLDIHYANDGQTAVDMARSLPVDIILLDIQLPIFSGLEAARRIRSCNETVEIVMITAYSKFEYAQQAVKNNTFDYIVKPYSIKTIQTMMDRLFEKIEQKHRKSRQIEENQRLKALLQHEFLQKLYLGSEFSDEQIAEYTEYLDLAPCAYLLCVHMVQSGQTALSKYLPSLQASFDVSFYSASFQSQSVCLLFAEQTETLQAAKSRLASKRVTGPAVFSDIQSDWKLLSREYKSLMARLPVDLQSSSSSSELLIFKMADAVLSKDEKHLMEFAQELLLGPEARDCNELEMRHFLLAIVHKIMVQVYSISEVQVSQLYREIGYPIQQEAGGGLQQAKHEFITCLTRFYDYFQANLTSRNERLLSQVKHRITEQYAKAISLEGLSSEIGLSPSYLSRLFKSQEGINLKDYILNIRVDKAKQALLEGKTVEQAGSETGFSDPAYFTKCFKRVVGLTPREYVQEKKRIS